MGLGGELGGAWAGSRLGSKVGGMVGHKDLGGALGKAVGGILGKKLLPFKKGGKVPGKKPIAALLHPGEYVLPAGVPPTTTQVVAVKKRHKK
jgi:hypothetical protein